MGFSEYTSQRNANRKVDDLVHQGSAPAISDAHAWVTTCRVDDLHDQLLSSDWKAPALPGPPDGDTRDPEAPDNAAIYPCLAFIRL